MKYIGESRSALIMIDPIISTRTRSPGWSAQVWRASSLWMCRCYCTIRYAAETESALLPLYVCARALLCQQQDRACLGCPAAPCHVTTGAGGDNGNGKIRKCREISVNYF
eukprot:COSAG01_NODE_3157_length_6489_cov_11.663380_4_plen_110_part_00